MIVLGPAGVGKQTLLRQLAGRKTAMEPRPSAWRYVYNFDAPHQQRALELPVRLGVKLRDDMQALVDELPAAIPAAFDSDQHRYPPAAARTTTRAHRRTIATRPAAEG